MVQLPLLQSKNLTKPMINIETLLSSSIADEYFDYDGKYLIMIDVLRASSVICSALFNGAKKVIPVENIDDAFELSKKSNSNYLICGERKSIKVDGFHLGNSPLEYNRNIVENNEIILTTSNGTRIFSKGKSAKKRVIASFTNLDFVLKDISSYISELKLNKNKIYLLFLCAGTNGNYSREDALLAGKIISSIISEYNEDYEICDSSELILNSYNTHKDNLKEYLSNSSHAKYMKSLNLHEDIEVCLNENIYPVLPVITEDGIVVEK